jgi:hypothetical protein
MWIQAVNLADFPVNYGIMRLDKLRLYRIHFTNCKKIKKLTLNI